MGLEAGARGAVTLLPLTRFESGHFHQVHPASPGDRYRFRLDGGNSYPDPCSRSQPEGPHGSSEIISPLKFAWKNPALSIGIKGQVIYEIHVGTATPEGTFKGLKENLPHYRELGVTILELMPINTFPGRLNWGYDGVNLFSPAAVYGTPDDLRALIDEAHGHGIAVLLDVAYNHFGPDGNYLSQFSPEFFTDKYKNDWGQSINFEGENSPVRQFFIQNAEMWIRDYRFDGLRLDATQDIRDASPCHVVTDIVHSARLAAHPRKIVVIAESEPQDSQLVTPPEPGGMGADALWIDDFHHTARVNATGDAAAYCQDYTGSAQELLSCAL